MATNNAIPSEIRGVSTFIVKTFVNLIVSVPFLIFAVYGLVLADEEVKADLLLPSVICGGIGGFLIVAGFSFRIFSIFSDANAC